MVAKRTRIVKEIVAPKLGKKFDPIEILEKIAEIAKQQDGAPLMREALIKIAKICKDHLPE